MTSTSDPGHGNPSGIAVLTQKGTTSKEMKTNKISKAIPVSDRGGL
jgi:hypothetical protein